MTRLGRPGRYTPLVRRVVAVNAAVLVGVAVVTVLVFSPGEVSSPVALKELAILAGALVVMFLLNLAAMRRALTPIERLRDFVRSVDPLAPGQRAPVEGVESEATELARAFNDALERLEHERLESARLALAAQEAERLRVAQELHDEVGQSLTAVLLQLGRLERRMPDASREGIVEAQEIVRSSLEEVRRISRSLRPEALDDLGLVSALKVLAERVEEGSTVRVETRIGGALPPLDADEELVLYRIAQEALTNVSRHSGGTTATLALSADPVEVVLHVSDDGRGLAGSQEGAGLRGMRERAVLVGGTLALESRAEGGTEVTLTLPLDRHQLWSR